MQAADIIKYPFWRYTYQNPDAIYASINSESTLVPKEIEKQSIQITSDIGDALP